MNDEYSEKIIVGITQILGSKIQRIQEKAEDLEKYIEVQNYQNEIFSAQISYLQKKITELEHEHARINGFDDGHKQPQRSIESLV